MVEKIRKQIRFIFLFILCMGIGFALLSSKLNINLAAKLSANTWDIYFDNVQVIDGSVSATTPTITNKTTVNYSVVFDKPGDYYEFTVDAVNDGTIDVMVESFHMNEMEEKLLRYINYQVTYDEDGDEVEIKEKDIIKAKRKTTYKVLVEYKRDIEESDLLEEDFELNLSFTVNYIKSDNTNVEYGEIFSFNYTGGEQNFTIPTTGIYKLEVWGAQGASYNNTYRGGYGGYSIGYIELNKDDILYINVGGKPTNSTTINRATTGGYNGGGNSTARGDLVTNAGGGATHIALESGLLKTFQNKQDKLLIVTGGGGGSSYLNTSRNGTGGSGGGYIGNNGVYGSTYNCESYGKGGTQTAGGSYYIHPNHFRYSSVNIPAAGFGYGSAGDPSIGGSGGGGGYYGGRGTSCIGGGGGGSGYIGNTNLYDKAMYCYSCSTSDEIETKTISTTNISEDATSQYAKVGNGYAKITQITDKKINMGNWKKTSQSVDINNITFNAEKGEVSFVTSLTNTTDYAELTFEIENEADINYYISKLRKNYYDDSKISYSVTYSDGSPVEVKNLLKVNTSKRVTIKIQLLDSSVSLNNEMFTLRLNLEEATSSEFYIGEIWEFAYTGHEESFTVPFKGQYELEVWGAQGGNIHNKATTTSYYATSGNITMNGGYGSYSVGNIHLEKSNMLYINIGGKGEDSDLSTTIRNGGYNGGGKGGTGLGSYNCYSGAGGGGATHIALKSGLLSTLSENVDSILIVAGGGGGALNHNYLSANGGTAGGISGGQGIVNRPGYQNYLGGTQSSGYKFGIGQDGTAGTDGDYNQAGSAGGGGGFYGGFTSQSKAESSAGGGGSGYIGNSNLTSKEMYCYSCTESSLESSKTISTTNTSSDPVSQYAKQGNGYARITYLGE